MNLRNLREDETDLLKDFLYEAIFIQEGVKPPPREIIEQSELKLYYEDFGSSRADNCIVAEDDGRVVGTVWTSTRLMNEMLELLRSQGYKKASLAVQKANYAVRMYEKVGFKTVDENDEDYIMVCEIGDTNGNS